MGKKLGLLLAVVALAGLSMPAFAAVENVKVGGDIHIKGIYRNNFDFIDDDIAGFKDQQHFIYSGVRIYVTADLTDNVSAMVRLINERDWGRTEPFNDENQVTLDLGYIKVTDLMVPGLALTAGRQEIKIGEGLVVGSRYNALNYTDNGALSTLATDLGLEKAFDAVRVDYQLQAVPLALTGFMAKIDETYGGNTPARGFGDITLYGLSGKWSAENFSVEPYFVNESFAYSEPEDNLITGGVRGEVKLACVPGLSLKGEYARQFGDNGVNGDYKGWAGYVGGDYEFPVNMKPTVGLTYSRYSGTDPGYAGNDIKAWQTVFPSDTASRIGAIAYPALTGMRLGESNMQVIKLGFGLQPTEKLGLGLNVFNLRNVERLGPGVSKSLGNEIDLGLTYAYTEDLSFGLDLGYFLKGGAIKDRVQNLTGTRSDAENAWQAIASMSVAF